MTRTSPVSHLTAFLDESGDPALTPSSSQYLIVAILATANPRLIALHIRRARRALGALAPGGEIKASRVEARVIERLLSVLAEEEIALVIVAVDKSKKRPVVGEALYQQAIAHAVRICVEQWPRLRLFVDKRYTNRRQQITMESTIREAIAGISDHVVVIELANSATRLELQAVDCVAWAFAQKYERGDDHFCRIVANKISVEELLK